MPCSMLNNPPPKKNTMKHSISRKVLPFTLGLTTLIFAGCVKGPDYQKVEAAWKTGNTQVASQEILKQASKENVEKYDERIRWMLNAGSIASINGDYAKSEECLNTAQAFIDAGTVKGSDNKTVGDQVSNFVSGAFEPTMQECVMIPVIQLYNAFGVSPQQDVLTSKAVALKDTQADMLELKAKTLFELQQDDSKPVSFGEGDFMVEIDLQKEARHNNDVLERMYPEEIIYFNPGEEELKSVYINPFAYWLSGIIALHTGETKDQVLNAQAPIQEALKQDPDNPLLLKLNQKLNEASSAKTISEIISIVTDKDASQDTPAYTYVIYEGGKAPAIGAKAAKIKVPLALNLAIKGLVVAASNLGAKHSGTHVLSTEYATAAVAALPNEATAYFPTLSSRGKAPELTVNGVAPTLLVDFDPLMKKRFGAEARKNLKSAIWNAAGQIAVRGVAIAGSLASLNVAIEKNNAWGVNIAVNSFQASVANAAQPLELSKPDSRTWGYLPRTISVAELKTPADGKIDISGESIDVPAEGINFVRIYKADKYFPATVQVFTITPSGEIIAAPVSRLSAPQRPDTNPQAQK